MREAHKTQTTGPSVVLEMLLAGRETVELWRPGLESSKAIADLLKN